MQRFTKEKSEIIKFRRGEIVDLIGTAGQKVQRLKILNDKGTIKFIVCWDHISKAEVSYPRSMLQRRGR